MAAPKDNAEFFRVWAPFMRNYALKRGIFPDDVDDAVSEMMLRHLERDSINNFDSDRVNFYKGEPRPARWKTFLGRAIELDVRGIRDKNSRTAYRETPIGAFEGRGAASTVLDLEPDHAEAVNDEVDMDADQRYIREKLKQIPRRNSQDLCDLVAVHDAVQKQLREDGEYTIKLLAEHFGIAVSTMTTWMHYYKKNCAALEGRMAPPKRPRTLRKNKKTDEGKK